MSNVNVAVGHCDLGKVLLAYRLTGCGKLRDLNLIGLKRSGFAPEEVKAMTRAYMYIFKSAEGNFESRLAKAHEKYKDDALIMEMVEFIDDALKGRRNIMTAEA